MKNFSRILIANRGKIAVRIQRTCRALGIETVALYTPGDQTSLHVRLADYCFPLSSVSDFSNYDHILEIAKNTGCDAIHPGYGFLAEDGDFIRLCEQSGIRFIGPPLQVVEYVTNKIAVLNNAKAAGFQVIEHSQRCYDSLSDPELGEEAERLGYPLVVKPCRGGRGRGEKLVSAPNRLLGALQHAQAESQINYGQKSIYLEKAIIPAHQVSVQVLGDRLGNLIHLGEREGSILLGNQKLIVESPAPCLSEEGRKDLLDTALALARLFEIQNAASIEFVVDSAGQYYFTEIKPRIQIDHPVTELITRIDLIEQQIRLAWGEALEFKQDDLYIHGSAVDCRITAEDPWTEFLPSPGRLVSLRLPGGPEVRVDTHLYSGCDISSEYDSLIAKLAVWSPSREITLRKMRRALDEIKFVGIPTNIPLLQSLLSDENFLSGQYDTSLKIPAFQYGSIPDEGAEVVEIAENQDDTGEKHFGFTEGDSQPVTERDLAIAAAIYYLKRHQITPPSLPERFNTAWHRSSRRLPE